ncbi:MAG: gluconate:H+ symporter [Negativicutes bacterium]|nr:gluconate:H+ symporter [Negativicutes bacterium]
MELLIVALGVVALLVLLVGFKFDGFIALILVSIGVGLAEGMELGKVTAAIYNGIGGQLKSLILILAFGAMLGKMLSDSGAAQRISTTFINKFGLKNIQGVMLLTAFIVGVTMFFEAGLIVIIPIIYTVAAETRLSLIHVGLPAVIGLSITHGFLPPHPGPAAVSIAYGANMGKTLLYGLIIAIPIAAFIAWMFAKLPYMKKILGSVPEGLAVPKVLKEEELPGFGVSMLAALLPIILMAIGTFADVYMDKKSPMMGYIHFFGDAPIALLITVLFSVWALGVARGRTLENVMKSVSGSVKGIAMIALVIAAGGAFKEVIVSSGVAVIIKNMTQHLSVSPIVLAWCIAAGIRLSVGSATVSVITASGIIAPMIPTCGASPELMVLATSCGSAFTSHVNDAGFWMYKEYFNLTVIDALKTRSVYTTVLGILGLLGCMMLHSFGL